MRYLIVLFMLLFVGFTSCGKDDPDLPPQAEQPPPDSPGKPEDPGDEGDSHDNDNNNGNSNNDQDDSMSNRLNVTVGNVLFHVILEDHAAVNAFKAQLPMTVNMSELNGNEKYFNLPAGLPAAPANPGTIHTGDLMLYGSATVVLFYKTFSTSYSYTRLGRVENPSGLAAALGPGSVRVRFELQ